MALLRGSGLNYLVQETPYSAFITIRKSFCREPKKFQNNTINEVIDEKLKLENDELKTMLEDKDFQLMSLKEEVEILQTRLDNAEKDRLNNIKNAKAAQDKHEEDIANLLSEKKKSNELMATFKSKNSDAFKVLKANEKTIYNLEKENENFVKQLADAKASKNDEKKEKLKLANEIKALKAEKEKPRRESKCTSTETDPQPPISESEIFLDNDDINTAPVSTSSGSIQAGDEPSNLPPTVSTQSLPTKEVFRQEDSGGLGIGFPAADYIKGINQIDLGPRVNDLSKF